MLTMPCLTLIAVVETSLYSDNTYWSNLIQFLQVSHEEKNSWKSESWENPAFENLDQLMDERQVQLL